VALRLRLRLRSVRGSSVDVVALVESGYETVRPELLVPVDVARALGCYPELPAGAVIKEYVLADGSRTRLIRVRGAVEVSVVEEDRVVGGVTADLVISERAEEVLISDKLADELRIVIIAAGEGLWCFRDELGRKVRRTR